MSAPRFYMLAPEPMQKSESKINRDGLGNRLSLLLTLTVCLIVMCSTSACAQIKNSMTPHDFKLILDDSNIEVRLEDAPWEMKHEDLVRWVKLSAESTALYFGRFPVERTIIRVSPGSDPECVGSASATYDDESRHGLVDIKVGTRTNRETLECSWTLTHEMCHLAFPIVEKKHAWLAEGLATYIEPIGRMRRGIITREDRWKELVTELPHGLPRAQDEGLGRNSRWGRVYWGGALYCLLADIELRANSAGAYSLESAMRQVMEQGGTAASQWSARESLEVADRSTRSSVFTDLFDTMRREPVGADLDKLWNLLGVRYSDNEICFDDSAPLAYVRDAIDGRNTLSQQYGFQTLPSLNRDLLPWREDYSGSTLACNLSDAATDRMSSKPEEDDPPLYRRKPLTPRGLVR